MALFSLAKGCETSSQPHGGLKTDKPKTYVKEEKSTLKTSIIDPSHKYVPTITEKIRRYRLQMMVHSVIYYRYNENIISDAEWSKRAKILVNLQKDNPDESKICVYYNLFKDFDGSTGFNLIFEPWAIHTAQELLKEKFGYNFTPDGGW